MKLSRKTRTMLTLGVLAFIGSSLILSVYHSKAVCTVTIKAVDPAQEPSDSAIPGIGGEAALPDYRIDVIKTSGSTVRLGTVMNTSAKDGLTWKLQDPILLAGVASIRVLDDDKLSNDVIDEVQIEGGSFSSERYHYDLEIRRTVRGALEYFYITPVGRTILCAIGLAVLLFIAQFVPLDIF